MRWKTILVPAAALLFGASPASAKGDFVEFRIAGPGLPHPVIIRLAPTRFGEPASPLPETAGPRYRVSAAIGFNSSDDVIPMPWTVTYFPAFAGRPARIFERFETGEERWWAPDPALQSAFDSRLPATSPWQTLTGLGAVAATLAAAAMLARKGSFRIA